MSGFEIFTFNFSKKTLNYNIINNIFFALNNKSKRSNPLSSIKYAFNYSSFFYLSFTKVIRKGNFHGADTCDLVDLCTVSKKETISVVLVYIGIIGYVLQI